MARKTLVLDKSALQAASPGFIKAFGAEYDFLLPDTLLHEIATERLDKRPDLTEKERGDLDRRINATFAKAVDEAGNRWLDCESALTWEVVRGCSSRYLPSVNPPIRPSAGLLSVEVQRGCLEYDERMGFLSKVVHSPKDDDGLQAMKRIGEQELFLQIERDYGSEKVIKSISEDAKGFAEVAQQKGMTVSTDFQPARDWLAFGLMLAARTYLPWKFKHYGDAPDQPKKPPNPFFDMIYRGYVAITDGILSSDKDLLKLTWACWPEKRPHIFAYDMGLGGIRHFQPEWKS